MKLVLVLLLVQLGVHAYDAKHSHMKHECIHDKKMKNHKIQVAVHESESLPFKMSHSSKKMSALRPLQRNHKINFFGNGFNFANLMWPNIQIQLNFDWVQQYVNWRPSLRAGYEVSAKLLQSVRYYFEGILRVKKAVLPKIRQMKCDSITIPAFSMIDVDLYVAVVPESDEKSSYFAAAVPCALTSTDRRPLIGTFVINFAFIKVERLYQFLYFSIFAHEFTHILGFSQALFHEYVNPSTGQKLPSVTTQISIQSTKNPAIVEEFSVITLKEVVDYARNYFSCSNLKGVPLENDGGDGTANSHWEKLFLPTEYMNPTMESPGRISEFTLNLLRGTGWYQVDSSGAQSYDWNKGAGCGHFSICPAGRGYCQAAEAGQDVCSTEYDAKVCDVNEGHLCDQRSVHFRLRHC